MLKPRSTLLTGIAIGILLSSLAYYLIPAFLYAPQAKPEPPPKEYDYYIIMDADTGTILSYISSVRVTVGDEYISENGHRYVVSKVEENRAYAQDFGPVDDKGADGEGLKKHTPGP